jgi:hypothetical protein
MPADRCRMPTVPENRALPADLAQANDHDSFAEAYTTESDANMTAATRLLAPQVFTTRFVEMCRRCSPL